MINDDLFIEQYRTSPNKPHQTPKSHTNAAAEGKADSDDEDDDDEEFYDLEDDEDDEDLLELERQRQRQIAVFSIHSSLPHSRSINYLAGL